MVLADEKALPLLRPQRTATLARLGRHIEAAREIDSLATLPSLPCREHIELASALAACAAAVPEDSVADSAPRERQAEALEGRAIEQLRSARSAADFSAQDYRRYVLINRDFVILHMHTEWESVRPR